MSATEPQGQEPDLSDADDLGGRRSDPDDRGGQRSRGWFHRSVTAVFLVVTLGAIAIMLRGQDWSVLGTTLRSQRPGLLALMVGLALLANAAALLAAMLAWRSMLSGVSDGVTAVGAARIFFVGQFAKYVPGKVFGFIVSIRIGKTMGVPATRMASAWLLTLVIGLLTGATVGLAVGPEVLGGSVIWFALAAVPIVVTLVRPQLISQAAVVVARLRRRPPPEATVPGRVIRRVVVTQLVSWLAGGVQLWFLAIAMGAPPAGSFLLCVGVFSLGAVAGVFAVFTPDGLGVREVILLGALSLVMPIPAAGVVALLSRLVVVVSELVTAGIGLLVVEFLRRRHARPGDSSATHVGRQSPVPVVSAPR
ncbi:lysylphosphatidylglycerol synthase transmembrane domain-containing protein [Solwaraspora sp. WMMD406]|uniref:lysylphosphatidylglycerol synthase transmembrane domain-containing protein n=1 Tax=Solwaraspora sp. WMMD406 TaxID=3016095 RepID=UPI0024179446|nr:lysylphosphatidylglycerol synthase transmembrane domain-containing protein [Solwaraspora sp. WMMD406]MDG4764935.1 lysylphosphatidylglycerol synthase transmembrane domain-containing protein [Solwaraspora sp. WMMD406]